MTITLSFVIEREAGSIVTSYDVWAKFGSYPECDGDGTYVGNFPIEASEDEVTGEFEATNNSENWRFIAIPRFMDQTGLPGRIEAV